MDYVPGTTKVAAVDSILQDRQQLFSLLKYNLTAAQERMKWFANKKRVDRSFVVGDWVYLRLQPYKQSLISSKRFGKLAPRFYGPYQVVQKVGEVSYKLDLQVLKSILCFMCQISRLNWVLRWFLGLLYLL